jgi:hydroxymethylglutaryl-CoA lyase
MKPVGNVCTENVVYALECAGLKTGIELQAIDRIGKEICQILGRPSLSIL